MELAASDKSILRDLAGRYSELAHLPVQKERLARYQRSNDLEIVRPIVLIDEVPWGEVRDEALRCRCAAPEAQGLEGWLRRTLYQWEHFQVDMVVPPAIRVGKAVRSTGIGLEVKDTQIKGSTGAYISSHEYVDQLATEADLAKIRIPEITYNREATEANLAFLRDVFDGLLPVELHGHVLGGSIWDWISTFRGVDNLLLDLGLRPEFMHQTAARFAEVIAAQSRQMEEQGLLDPDQVTLHCTPACTKDLPAADFKGTVRAQDVWGRCAAQIFSAVSPEMHDEFDLAYNQKLFGGCGLLYYGCCEPLDTKIGILRKRFPNLRKVSITPWADPVRAAHNIGRDYVLAGKPNPAFVAGATFNPAPVEEEIARYCEACRETRTPLEFVIKDISTIANRPENLTQWAATVNRVIDRYYGAS
jgi:hypothetical protein